LTLFENHHLKLAYLNGRALDKLCHPPILAKPV
jgi:hypothetical protein